MISVNPEGEKGVLRDLSSEDKVELLSLMRTINPDTNERGCYATGSSKSKQFREVIGERAMK